MSAKIHARPFYGCMSLYLPALGKCAWTQRHSQHQMDTHVGICKRNSCRGIRAYKQGTHSCVFVYVHVYVYMCIYAYAYGYVYVYVCV